MLGITVVFQLGSGCWSVKFPLSVFTPECMVSVMIVCLWCWCDLPQRVESNRSGVVHFLFDVVNRMI
jgi:hypothetical protein